MEPICSDGSIKTHRRRLQLELWRQRTGKSQDESCHYLLSRKRPLSVAVSNMVFPAHPVKPLSRKSTVPGSKANGTLADASNRQDCAVVSGPAGRKISLKRMEASSLRRRTAEIPAFREKKRLSGPVIKSRSLGKKGDNIVNLGSGRRDQRISQSSPRLEVLGPNPNETVACRQEEEVQSLKNEELKTFLSDAEFAPMEQPNSETTFVSRNFCTPSKKVKFASPDKSLLRRSSVVKLYLVDSKSSKFRRKSDISKSVVTPVRQSSRIQTFASVLPTYLQDRRSLFDSPSQLSGGEDVTLIPNHYVQTPLNRGNLRCRSASRSTPAMFVASDLSKHDESSVTDDEVSFLS